MSEESAQVVIIGGGVMGASTAFHLAEAGITDVLLLERGDLAGGSTTKSAGGVRAQFTDAVNIALGARSLAAFEDFARRPGADIDLRQVGYLFLHTTPAGLAAAESAVALQNSMGVESRMLSPDEASALSPGVITDDVLGATFHARDGYCTPEAVVQGYAKAARAMGVRIRTHEEVMGVDVEGGEITGVHTAAGRITTGTVVCTAGAWSRSIGEMAGVDLPVEPLRRQIIVTEPLDAAAQERFHGTMPMTIDAASTFYLHREGPALLFGMSYRGETTGFRDGYSEDWLPELVAAMERRAPALLDIGMAYRWAGYYEKTPDDNALIGEAVQVSRFLYATGFSGHGFLQGPAIGEVMRDLVLGRDPVVDVSQFRADRFAEGTHLVEHGIV